jgi:hypothetical protein
MRAFPLQWPDGFPRREGKKQKSNFITTLGKARDEVYAEIKRLGGINPIISTNIPVKGNGQLYASMRTVDGDEGVAVYFTWHNEQMVLACDKYDGIADNLRAIFLSLDAMRGLTRWGCSDILNRAFKGFKALPEKTVEYYWDVLECKPEANFDELREAYKRLAKIYHPDVKDTGDVEKFNRIQNAYDTARAAFEM